MLSPAFSTTLAKNYKNVYALTPKGRKIAIAANETFDTGPELRLQHIYTEEIWQKINGLVNEVDWSDKTIMDICAGTGYLSYHLLEKIRPKKLTLLDISQKELTMAKKLLSNKYPNVDIDYICRDFQKNTEIGKFDIIIGNSFLHHFYNLPQAISEIKKLLNPEGIFITLHEPTIMALAIESGNKKLILKGYLNGKSYIEDFRHNEAGSVRRGEACDVWMFNKKELVEIFRKTGFKIVETQNWHILKPYILAKKGLHLMNGKVDLTEIEQQEIRKAIKIDKILQRILPAYFFGSLSLMAKK